MYYKVLLQYYYVLQSSTPVLLCATKFYSSTTVCYYSSTALYCSSTTLYYSTTPVLQGTTTLFYKNTTPVLLYYKVPFHYSVLQSAFPYYKVLLRTEESYMKWHWHCEEQQVSPSNLTKYCACHAKCFECLILVTYGFYSAQSNRCHPPASPKTTPATQRLPYLILVAYDTLFARRGATGVTLQPHQILLLPRKKTRMLNPRHIWNVFTIGRSNKCHPPTSPNTAAATQKDSHA